MGYGFDQTGGGLGGGFNQFRNRFRASPWYGRMFPNPAADPRYNPLGTAFANAGADPTVQGTMTLGGVPGSGAGSLGQGFRRTTTDKFARGTYAPGGGAPSGFIPSGSKFVSQAAADRGPASEPVIPPPDETGATQWAGVLAANQGDVRRATAAWNTLQARTTGYADPGVGAPRIIGWNWGQPLYAGQTSQDTYGNPTGYGPGGQYTAYNPARDPYAVPTRTSLGTIPRVRAGADVPRSRIGTARRR